MKARIAIGIFALALASCGSAKEDFGANGPMQDSAVELTPQERADKLPNKLFNGVWNNSLPEIERELTADPSQFTSENLEGNTPFGLALIKRRKAIAERLLTTMSPAQLSHQNKEGESYVFLAAQSGMPEIITAMADKYYQSLGAWEDYEFSGLDRTDVKGRRALAVASDRRVAEALEQQYYRGVTLGVSDLPFWQFTMNSDLTNRSFLHWAAEYGHDDVITWAAGRICEAGPWENSDYALVSVPSGALTYAIRAMQTHVLGDWALPTDLIFNRADDDYQTALHVAIYQKRWSSVRALGSCRWLDYDLSDLNSETPLHAFLKTISAFQVQHDQEVRETFQFLTSSNTRLRLKTPAYRASLRDNEGNTPMHLAARLADPFFYQTLAQFGDIHVTDAQGKTAESVFRNRQAQVKAHAQ